MKVRMYSIFDSYNEKWSIPFGLVDDFEDEFGNGIRRFMYMFVSNPEMRMRAADYELRCVGLFDADSGYFSGYLCVEMEDPSDFKFVIKGTDILKYLDDPNIHTNEIMDELRKERSKDVQK